MLIDNKKKASGSLWEHYGFVKKTRDDPSDPKPEDWVDLEEVRKMLFLETRGHCCSLKCLAGLSSWKMLVWRMFVACVCFCVYVPIYADKLLRFL